MKKIKSFNELDPYTKMDLYKNLPDELKRVIRGYFTIFERHGMKKELPFFPSPDSYYHKIRHCPRGISSDLSLSTFFYRRIRKYYEFEIRVFASLNALVNIWDILIFPQWRKNMKPDDILIDTKVFASRFVKQVPFRIPVTHFHRNTDCVLITYVTKRYPSQDATSRQAHLYLFVEYVKQLSQHLESLRKTFLRK